MTLSVMAETLLGCLRAVGLGQVGGDLALGNPFARVPGTFTSTESTPVSTALAWLRRGCCRCPTSTLWKDATVSNSTAASVA